MELRYQPFQELSIITEVFQKEQKKSLKSDERVGGCAQSSRSKFS